MDINIGERLRTIREMYGFSQRALAKRADVTNGIISMTVTQGREQCRAEADRGYRYGFDVEGGEESKGCHFIENVP